MPAMPIPATTSSESSAATTEDLLRFIGSSPTPYHAVEAAIAILNEAGFGELDPRASWLELAPGRYFVKQGDSALAAFVIPDAPIVRGFRLIGAHTDSPNLRLKPRAEYAREGYLQLGVEVYGGALLNSWLDRDLGLAGRVVVREGDTLQTRLVRISRPLCRVAQLAIHLDRDVNERGVVLNKQEHLAPLLALQSSLPAAKGLGAMSVLGELLASELGVSPLAVASSELMLFDLTPPALGGLHGEFVFAPRLDNQAMCHAGLSALVRAAAAAEASDLVPLVVLFDHEEVGSASAYGAESPLLPVLLERIVLGRGGAKDDVHRALARSLCVSADMAHAVHPNYVERHEARHRVALNGGPVIKVNTQQRYATCARTAALFTEICRRKEVPVQEYVHRTDLPCGSTIGPITATKLGIRTVDVGNPMLSMHSARELAGASDPALMVRALTAFLTCEDPF